MPDPADLAGIEIEREEARREQQRAYEKADRIKHGRSECDCGEAIAPMRMAMGADKCIDCQTIHETRYGYL